MNAQYYDLGYEAFQDGIRIDDCPKTLTARQQTDWLVGWKQAESDQELWWHCPT